MSGKLRIVVDTNIFISAAFRKPPSLPHAIYESIKSQNCILITSPAILEEIEDVINRKEIAKRTEMNQAQRKKFIKDLIDITLIVTGEGDQNIIKDDPDDDKFLYTAADGNADYIVSGDHHLLDLKEYNGIPILSPKDFLETLEKEQKHEKTSE